MRALVLATSLGLALVACGKSGPAGKTPDGAGGAAEVVDEAPEPESAGTKKDQCERLGAVIERVETGTSIVNVNDGSKMKELAAARRAAGEEAAALALEDEAVVKLRDRYVALCNAMAEALDGVASPERDARVAAVEKHSQLDADVSTLVDDLNATCSGS